MIHDGGKFADTSMAEARTAVYAPVYEVSKGLTALPEHTARKKQREQRAGLKVQERKQRQKNALDTSLLYPVEESVASAKQVKEMSPDYFMQFCEQIKGLRLWGAGGVFAEIKGIKPKSKEEEEEASKCGDHPEVLSNPSRLEVYEPNEKKLKAFESLDEIYAKRSVLWFSECLGSCGSVVGEEYPALAKIHNQQISDKTKKSLKTACGQIFDAIGNYRVLSSVDDDRERQHRIILAVLHQWNSREYKNGNTEVIEGGWVGAQLRKAFIYDCVNKSVESYVYKLSMYGYVNASIEGIEAELAGVSKKELRKMTADQRDSLVYAALNDEDEEPPKSQAVQESKEPQESKESKEPQESKESKEPQESKELRVHEVPPQPSTRRSVVRKYVSLFSALDKLEPSVSSARVVGVEPSNPFVPDNYQPPTKTDKPAKASKKKKERGEHPYLKRKREQAQRALVAEDKELIAFSFASDSKCAPTDYDPSIFGEPQETFVPDDWQTPDDACSGMAFAML
ncbi:hypothetical protein [Helicobacter suis]|uniref:hypothetical protein n=1 Tax=Helicobacter suis TaxID=104628 RepID=UPI0013CF7260|nr:hypothetical protein [Helicobacter suis]